MRILTFNLRFANPLDGPNHWDHRKELVVETILALDPDLVGTQEGTVPQLDYLTQHLQGFLPLVAHRQVDPTCQYPTIFYRQGFQVKESGEFWLGGRLMTIDGDIPEHFKNFHPKFASNYWSGWTWVLFKRLNPCCDSYYP